MNIQEEFSKISMRHRKIYSTGGTIDVVSKKDAIRIASEYQRYMRKEKNKQLKELHLFDILNSLTIREKKILELRFIELESLESVAKIFFVTRERIRQIEAKALEKLRQKAKTPISESLNESNLTL